VNTMKVITVLGTRPEIIRLSCVMDLLDRSVNHLIVHTGQNYDYELNEIFFEELGVRKPDYFLGVDTSSLGKVLGNILISIEDVLKRERPDAMLILGDTNSSIAGIMARRMKIPLYHMEAGNRSFDFNVPEEINRRMIDHISDFNLVYTEHARRHLLSEGIPHRFVYLTGSPMKEVIMRHKERIDASKILTELGLKPKAFFIVSMHREENVDNRRNLNLLLQSLNALAEKYKMPVIVSTHPRTRKRLEELSETAIDPNIKFSKPFGFFDYNNLQMNAFCAISDSGTISEESAILGFPAITVRNAMERPEALDAGSLILTGLDTDVIDGAVSQVTSYEVSNRHVPTEYEIDNVSRRVVNLIMGTARLNNRWQGIELNDCER